VDPTQVKRDPDGVMRCVRCAFRYDLGPAEVAERAGTGLQAVQKAVEATPEDRLGRRPAPDVWSVNAYTRHLADAAQVILNRVNTIAEQDRPALPYHDQDEEAAEVSADEIPARESLAPLEQRVRAFQDRIRSLPPDAWDRVGIHARAGEVRLSEIAQDMPHELEHHAMDIQSIGSKR
jgi:hypothetical protein